MQQIHNTRQLRLSVSQGQHEFRLVLRGGLYSRKTITLSKSGRFRVTNHIDASIRRLSGRQLYTESNIGKAMKCGALIAVD